MDLLHRKGCHLGGPTKKTSDTRAAAWVVCQLLRRQDAITMMRKQYSKEDRQSDQFLNTQINEILNREEIQNQLQEL